MKISTSMQYDEIISAFSKNVRSEKDMPDAENYFVGDDIFLGDIDEDGNFVLKCYAKSRYGKMDPLDTSIRGKVIQEESGKASIEFSFVQDKNRRSISYIIPAIGVSMFFSVAFSEIKLACIILAVSIVVFLLAFFDPFSKLRLHRQLKKIVDSE